MLWDSLLRCVESVRQYLRSPTVRFDVVGSNPFGDVSKGFDVEAEEILRKCIANALSDVAVLGEEEGLKVYGSGAPKWIAVIDPVDGSTNFSFNIPWASISLAVAPYKSGARIRDTVFAVVAEIFRDSMYIYRDGKVVVAGSRLSGRRSEPAPIVLGYFDSEGSAQPVLSYISRSSRKLTIRALGSAALDIVYVGLGNAEAFIDARAKLRNVDVAAAVRIATALGAKAVDCSDGFRDALDIGIENGERVACIAVAYSEAEYRRVLESLCESPYIKPKCLGKPS
jgi:myo-inositol-1(or 4)-monophosphatase